jgi:hypothetical protein
LGEKAVDRAVAALLRQRMSSSQSLLYVFSQHSKPSRWMPWELGYFDGMSGRVGIVPVVKSEEDSFTGQEYLSLYPYVDSAPLEGEHKPVLWINQSLIWYTKLRSWIKGRPMTRHPGT